MTSVTADSEVNADSRGRKPVWNVPAASNGAIEVSSVVDAVSWPALSESTKSSSDSLKSLSDSGLLISSSHSPKANNSKSCSNPNPNLNNAENSMPPTRQIPLKHVSNSNSNHASHQLVSTPEPSPRGSSSGSNDQNRGHSNNGSRRGGNAGGGSNQNHGSREWNRYRNNPHMHRGGFRTYSRPPPFVAPPPLPRPYAGTAMGYTDFPSPMYYVTPQQYPEALRGMPFVPHPVPHAMFFPSLDPQRATLLKQIDYYFSSENLCKDIYLRSHMDEQGWVLVSLIAGFNKVKALTNNIQYILDTVRFSTLVETQGDKIRRRNDWMNWLYQPNNMVSPSNPESPRAANHNTVTTQLQNVSLDGAPSTANHTSHTDVVLTRSASGNLSNQFPVIGESSRAGSGQFTGFLDSRSLTRSDTF